jgi:hypothetical protein
MYVPYIKQEEPLKSECQHFLDCIREGISPLTDGQQGLELVRILEASSTSLKQGGAPVPLQSGAFRNGLRELPQGRRALVPESLNANRQESVVRA